MNVEVTVPIDVPERYEEWVFDVKDSGGVELGFETR